MSNIKKPKEHKIYDVLYVDEVSTSQKVKDEFKSKQHIKENGKPKAYILKHDVSEFNSNLFRQKEKICKVCKGHGKTVYISNPRIESDSTWVKECDKCGTAYNFFTPTPLQRVIKDLNAPVINVIAGFGSGKTEFDMWYASRRAITVDGSEIMIAGGSKEGLDQAKGFIKGHFARPWKYSKEKKGDFMVMNDKLWKLKNGSIIRWLSADTNDVEKYRSWQLDLVIMVEASADAFYKGGDYSFWNEIKKRMRNAVANVNAENTEGDMFDYITEQGKVTPYIHGTIHQIILESNPKNSDIIQEVFNNSAILMTTEKVANRDKIIKKFIEKYKADENGESGIVSILASSNDNPLLTEKYLKDAFHGKSSAYIARMRDADLSKNEGQVFQEALDHSVDRNSSMHYKEADHIISVFDPGTTDPAATLYAAFWKNYNNSGKPKVKIFDAHKTKGGATREGNSISEAAEHFDATELHYGLSNYDAVNHKIARWYIHPITGKKKRVIRIADSAMWKTEKAGDEMIQDHITEAERYRKKGLEFKQALKGSDSIEYGITLVNTYFGEDIIEWAKDLEHLEEEFIKYEYVTKSNGKLVPKDKDNHLMDTLRYLIFEIDAKLTDIGNAPTLITGDSDKIREILERRKINRDSRFLKEQSAIEALGMPTYGFDNLSRTELLESNKKNKFDNTRKKVFN